MLKSIRIEPVPQPPAVLSAWTMPSDVPLFGSVEMSVFQGLSASKSRPATVVVGTLLVLVEVVLGRDVDVLELVDDVEVDVELVVGRLVDVEVEVEVVVGRLVEVEVVGGAVVDVAVDVVVGTVVDVDVEVVVGRLVEVDDEVDVDDEVEVVVGGVVDEDVEVVVGTAVDEELLDDVEVAGRVLEVLVVELEVVVVFFLRAIAVAAHTQPPHGPPAPQSASVSHSSPAVTSTMPSPQADAPAVKRRRVVARADSVPASDAHADSSTFAASRTPRSAPHADQRAWTLATVPRCVTRTRAAPQSA